MYTYPAEYIIINYQSLGYDHDLIIQAWTDCQGSHHLFYNYLHDLKLARDRLNNRQTTYLITAETARLLKKGQRTYHLRLRFKGDTSLDYLELRKLGLFSKKAFRHIKGLSLQYADNQHERTQALKKRQMRILGNHLDRNLRKMEHLSIDLNFWKTREAVNVGPLLKNLKQKFVSLISLSLSLRRSFGITVWVLVSFERLFARMRPTLKHLHLDFSGNESSYIPDFPEGLGIMIMNRLPKLESLSLNFSWTSFSTKVVRLLIHAACTHLHSLRSLTLIFEGCKIAQEHWNSYPKHNLMSNLQYLKVSLESCKDLSRDYLSVVGHDIMSLCPLLSELNISTLNCLRLPDGFERGLEREFCQRLRLKRLKLLYSQEQERNWESYQEILAFEMNREMKMEEEIKKMEVEVMEVKEKVGGEEELQWYYQTKMEEEQAPKKWELDEFACVESGWETFELEREMVEQEKHDRAEKMDWIWMMTRYKKRFIDKEEMKMKRKNI